MTIALFTFYRKRDKSVHDVVIYSDAEGYINEALHRERVKSKVYDIRKDPVNHPLRKGLLKSELLPYQLVSV